MSIPMFRLNSGNANAIGQGDPEDAATGGVFLNGYFAIHTFNDLFADGQADT